MIKIYNIAGKLLPNHLLSTPKGLIVIDTGFSGGGPKFFKRFMKIGKPNDIKYLFLTHSHDDHVGYAKEIVDKTGARIVAHKEAVPFLVRGKCSIPKDAGYTSKRAAVSANLQHKINIPKSGFLPLKMKSSDIIISDETQQPLAEIGIKIVHLPGHTKDQIGLFIEGDRSLFCGDAAMDTFLNVSFHPIWLEDKEALQSTWQKIIDLNPSIIYPSHGKPIQVHSLKKNLHYFDSREIIKHSLY